MVAAGLALAGTKVSAQPLSPHVAVGPTPEARPESQTAAPTASRAIIEKTGAQPRPFRILSIDGGGMKGVVPATVLLTLNSKLRLLNKPGVGDSFDLFAGTSTGCIIAAALASAPVAATNGGRRCDDPDDMLRIYREKGSTIFDRGSGFWERTRHNPFDLLGELYSDKGKKQAFLEAFGNIRLRQLTKNFVSTYYEMSPQPRAVIAAAGPLFRENNQADFGDLYLRDVVHASSSAPVYFNPAKIDNGKIQAVDGGVFANNPAAAAYFSAGGLLDPSGLAGIEIVSLGCGASTVSYPTHRASWGPAEWVAPHDGVPLINLVSDSQSSVIDWELRSLLGPRYERFQPQLPPLVGHNGRQLGAMDDGSVESLEALQAATLRYVLDPAVDARLNAIAAKL
jgi:hypothetical protein